jgi:hypothetical protein
MFDQRALRNLVHPALFHCSLLLFLFQHAQVLVVRVCRPERIDGNLAESIPPLLVHSGQGSKSAAPERHRTSRAIVCHRTTQIFGDFLFQLIE